MFLLKRSVSRCWRRLLKSTFYFHNHSNLILHNHTVESINIRSLHLVWISEFPEENKCLVFKFQVIRYFFENSLGFKRLWFNLKFHYSRKWKRIYFVGYIGKSFRRMIALDPWILFFSWLPFSMFCYWIASTN